MPVKVYFVREGSQMQSGGPSYVKSLASCVDEIGLKKGDWVQGLNGPGPHFGDQSIEGSPPDEYKHVVCKIDEDEAKASGWPPGYYRIELAPGEVEAAWGAPKVPWEQS